MTQPIEGRVIPPSRNNNAPRTEYVYVQNKGTGQNQTQGTPRTSQGDTTSRTRIAQRVRGINETRWANRIAGEPRQATTPPFGLPRFLGNRTVLASAWLVSMAVVGYDEWKRNHIFPRPYRLWWVSLFYGLLALASFVDALVPLVNALAVGYTIMLVWQYFNGQGQFA
jgi:hypothetical protein